VSADRIARFRALAEKEPDKPLHAFALAQAFNQFYHRHPIAQEADTAVRNRRLAVARIFRREMSTLLGLLGIPEPERM